MIPNSQKSTFVVASTPVSSTKILQTVIALQVFQGNRDENSKVLNHFPHAIWAQYFRVIAVTWHNHVSLRMDFITC